MTIEDQNEIDMRSKIEQILNRRITRHYEDKEVVFIDDALNAMRDIVEDSEVYAAQEVEASKPTPLEGDELHAFAKLKVQYNGRLLFSENQQRIMSSNFSYWDTKQLLKRRKEASRDSN